MSNTTQPRPIFEIARDIRREWKNVNFGAEPYLEALASLSKPTDKVGLDSAKSITLYFLSNASTFRGERAKQLKQELKAIFNIK